MPNIPERHWNILKQTLKKKEREENNTHTEKANGVR